MYEGSCLCGRISYSIEGELSEFGYCHCSSCRKASGSAHGANSGIQRSQLTLHDPDELLKFYESSPGKFRAFCSQCGSPLYTWIEKSRDQIRIRLGSLDTPFYDTAKAHTFVGDKAPWEKIEGDLPQFEEWASRDVLVQAGSLQPDD